MKKTLIVVSHPNIDNSVINKRWIEELKKYPDQYTVHELYKIYPDGKVDVKTEQNRIEAHNHLILQFPIYWFNCPPLLKTWLDEVFTRGWAYGENGNKLKNKKIGVAVSAGGTSDKDYALTGRYKSPLAQVLLPFELTANYVQAEFLPSFAYYGAEYHMSSDNVQQSAVDYITYLSNI